MTTPDLTEARRLADWCDQHSSGVYRPSAEAATMLRALADELERLRAQVAHLVDDLTEEVAGEEEATYYRLRDGKDVLFSNMVGACARLLAAPAQQADHTELLRVLANRARCFPGFPMGYHLPEVFAALGETPPQPDEAPSLTVGERAEPLTDEWIEGAFTDDEKRYACEFEPTESTVPFQAAVRVVRAAFIRGTLAQPAAQAEPVPGAVWGMYGEQSVCLIQRGTEDDRIAKAGGERLYRRGAAASNPPAQGVELPPLPEPRTLSRGDEDGPIQLDYTADQMHAYARAAIAALTAERDDLRAEVGAMRDDARRLDWLDAEISGDPGGRRIMCLPGGLRAAIDAASQKEQQE